MFLLIFFTNSPETFRILRRIQRHITTNVQYIGLQVKHLTFLSYFNQTFIFSTVFRKNTAHKISRKSVQWEPSCSMLTDGQQTGMTKLRVAFRNFANAHKTFVCISLKKTGKKKCVVQIEYSLHRPEQALRFPEG